ncbi:hypothetical protein C8F04DRAFT_942887 [Mycena alexandri]|uniref:Uncharacterized protein n=1 Tax=Mycena alexandri TaxID=1745969 RepID=A0AAD6XG81_9AGAR|nr:hypothetical protein C8F04DRAFT_942887 [Mycena alexandri]
MFFHDLGIPASDFTVSVKVYNVLQDVLAVSVPATMFMKPVLSGNETLRCPAFAFVVEHATTGQRLLFDLGPRKDPLNAAPRTAEFIRSGMVYMPVSRDIIEQLEEDGVDVSSINAAIWR